MRRVCGIFVRGVSSQVGPEGSCIQPASLLTSAGGRESEMK